MMQETVIQFEGTVYENGYGQVAKKVMKDKTISTTAKAIYSYLCSYAGGNLLDAREAFPTIPTILEDLNLSENTFLKHRKQLLDAGYLEIKKNHRQSNGTFDHNIYSIVAVVREVDCTPSTKQTIEEKNHTSKNEVRNHTAKNEVENHTSKSSGRKICGTNINKKIINTNKDLNNTNNKHTVVADDKIENISHYVRTKVGTSVAKRTLSIFLEQYGAEHIMLYTDYIHRHIDRYTRNPAGALVSAIKDQWNIDDNKQHSAEIDVRYTNFYALFPKEA